jgi:hypothetical protein
MSRKTANPAKPANVADVTKAAVTPPKGPTEVLTTARPDRVNPKGRAAEHFRIKDEQEPQENHDDVQAEEPVLAMVDGGGSGPFAEATRDAAPTAQVQEGLMGVASSGAAAGVTGLGLTGNAAGLTSALGMAGTATAPGAFYSAHMPLMGLGVGVAAASIGRSSSTSATVVADAPRPATYMKITAIDKDTGKSDSDFITRDTTLTVRGTLTGEWRSGDKAQVSVDGVNWTDVTVRNGRWSFTDPRTLEDGQHTYHVRVIDPAGQLIERNRQKVTVDTQAPTASIERMGIDEDTGSSNSDWITRDKSLTFSGTLTGVLNPGETVQISWDGVIWHDLSVQGNDWSIRRTLREGEYTVRVRIVDTAGNTASVATQSLIIDTNADERNDLSVSFDAGDAIVLSVTGIDDDIDLNQVSVTVFDQHGQEAQATYDAGSGKWVVADGSHALSGALQAHIHVQDIAGNTANASGALLSYTENRRADSFMGSVQAHANQEVTTYQFWNPTTQRRSDTSPDGFFRIDSEGRIFLTELGAASYVNDADDTQTGGPLNRHSYWVQATTAQGVLPSRIRVTLQEKNAVCDDPHLQYLIDLDTSGSVHYKLQEGRILSVTLDENFIESEEDLGEVDRDKQKIRMVSSGGDPNNNRVTLDLLLDGTTNTTDPGAYLDSVSCINLQADKDVYLDIDSLQRNDGTGSGDARLADRFMRSLEKVVTSNDPLNANIWGYTSVNFTNRGSAHWMPALKNIALQSGGDIDLRINNRQEDFPWSPNTPPPRDVDRGDYFMQLLETIDLESQGKVIFHINNFNGDEFMRSLTSITAIGGLGDAGGDVRGYFDSQGSGGMGGIQGDDGYAEGYLPLLEVVTLINHNQTSRQVGELDFNNSGGAHHYMGNLSLIHLESRRVETLKFKNAGGGAHYMGALEAIRMTHSTDVATLWIKNTSNYHDEDQMLRDASNFMTGLKTIDIVSEGRVQFDMVNGGSAYYLNNDYSQQYLTPAGLNFLPSLQSISIRAGDMKQLDFDMSKVQVEDETSLAALSSLTLRGGEIRAYFHHSMESAEWINFDHIQGNSNGVVDTLSARTDWRNQMVVIGGFDAGDVDDVLQFDFNPWDQMDIQDINQLVISREGEHVRIAYHEATGYKGSVVLLGVADTFVAAENLLIGPL